MEIWKEIKDYPNYMVSNLGRVKSLNYNHTGVEQIRKLKKNDKGYLSINLSKNNNVEWFLVHRLEAIAFDLPIPEHLKNIPIEKLEINHKDENTQNNHLDNLEWTDSKGNKDWGGYKKRLSESMKKYKKTEEHIRKIAEANVNGKLSKSVLQIDKNTNKVIAEFPSMAEVERQLGIKASHISMCCNGKRNIAGGYKWQYKQKEAEASAD